jgi:signal peptidase I
MSKEQKRQPFEIGGRKASAAPVNRPAENSSATRQLGGPIQSFFNDYGTRETIESILIAIVLAMLFRTFQAEAFIIPTGSMAPGLQGQHIDVVCDKCKFQYRTGATEENSTRPVDDRYPVIDTFCPICQYQLHLRRSKDADHRSVQGDRILVNKYIYDFQTPERFDVIVFKYPNNGKQNYIKRLVGMPGDNLLIECGDIYSLKPLAEGEGWTREIIRKSPEKLLAMLQLVDDNHFIAPEMRKVNWPWRWQQWSVPEAKRAWNIVESAGKPLYQISADAASTPQWLRYRHVIPQPSDWELISEGRQVARLQNFDGRWIGDYYAYNDNIISHPKRSQNFRYISYGANFVGDLGLEALVEVQGKSGKLLLDLVEGGIHFQCEIDLQNGQAKLSCQDQAIKFRSPSGEVVAEPTAATALNGPGRYLVKFVNADDQLRLWVNDKLVEFTTSLYSREGRVYPSWSETDPGDAEPLGVGSLNASLKIERLRVWRDIYYISTSQRDPRRSDAQIGEGTVSPANLLEFSESPRKWSSPLVRGALDGRYRPNEPMFRLADGQYMPMGDNSPASSDARVWPGAPYVEEALLLGRALFIYWPHSLNKPIPFFPNFQRMGPIK